MNLSERDLALVSAYLDGELDGDTVRLIRERLQQEPELRQALAGFQEISEALRALRPAQPLLQPRADAAFGRRKLLVAASLVCLVLLGGLLVVGGMQSFDTPLDWHERFLAQDYMNQDKLEPVVITKWIGQGPDLTSANLTLVDVGQDSEGSVFLHYAGLNGCRLTFGTHLKKPMMPDASPRTLSVSWSFGGFQYSLLAIGMDGARFQAITDLLKEKSREDQPDGQLFAVVREKTRQAAPCA